MIRCNLTAIAALAVLVCATTVHTQEKQPKIAMTPVTYEGLKQEVLKQRGKVVVVDFWGSFCVPCITKGFPHMKEMQKKYADRGLAVITVSIDDPENEDAVVSANKILDTQKIPFRNVHLTDPAAQGRLGIKTVPCYYVFDRSGRWVRFGGSETAHFEYDEIEKTVVQMLNEK